MSNPLIVGVDVHRKANAASFMDDQGHELAPRLAFDNNRPGTEAFAQHLADLASNGNFDAIQIAEPPKGDGEAPARPLTGSGFFSFTLSASTRRSKKDLSPSMPSTHA